MGGAVAAVMGDLLVGLLCGSREVRSGPRRKMPAPAGRWNAALTDWADLVDSARERAAEMLPPFGRRWAHVQGVARRAVELTVDLNVGDRDVVVAAAWLHDIGYAPQIARSGFHPLDGARYLRRDGFPVAVVALVAYHLGAVVEAHERGLSDELAQFPAPPELLLRRLTAADMTIGPTGLPVSACERIAEILTRHPPQHPVHRAVTTSGGLLIDTANVEDARARTRTAQHRAPRSSRH